RGAGLFPRGAPPSSFGASPPVRAGLLRQGGVSAPFFDAWRRRLQPPVQQVATPLRHPPVPAASSLFGFSPPRAGRVPRRPPASDGRASRPERRAARGWGRRPSRSP